MTHRIDWMKGAFALLGTMLLVFVLWPLLQTIISSTPHNLWETIIAAKVRGAIGLTFYASALATVIAILTGVPLAYLLARHEFPGKGVIEGLIDLPIVVPHTAAGIALLMVFGRDGMLGKAFGAIGVRFVSSVPGIVIAMLFVSMPFLVDAAKEGFKSVDPRLEHVARTLGATPWYAFRKVALPLAWRSVLSGTVLMWARGLSEFGAVVILAYHPMIAPVLIYERFASYGLNYAQPVTVWVILASLVVFILLRTVASRGKR